MQILNVSFISRLNFDYKHFLSNSYYASLKCLTAHSFVRHSKQRILSTYTIKATLKRKYYFYTNPCTLRSCFILRRIVSAYVRHSKAFGKDCLAWNKQTIPVVKLIMEDYCEYVIILSHYKIDYLLNGSADYLILT